LKHFSFFEHPEVGCLTCFRNVKVYIKMYLKVHWYSEVLIVLSKDNFVYNHEVLAQLSAKSRKNSIFSCWHFCNVTNYINENLPSKTSHHKQHIDCIMYLRAFIKSLKYFNSLRFRSATFWSIFLLQVNPSPAILEIILVHSLLLTVSFIRE